MRHTTRPRPVRDTRGLGCWLQYPHVVTKEEVHDGLCGACGEHFAFKVCLCVEVRNACGVVEVEVGDEENVDCLQVHCVEVGQRQLPLVARVNATVKLGQSQQAGKEKGASRVLVYVCV